MGKGGGGSSAPAPSSSTVSQVQIPSELVPYYKDVMNRAQDASTAAYTPYGGNRIAPFTSQQQYAFDLANQSASNYIPNLNAANQQAAIAGQTTPNVNMAQYMNPFVQNVIQPQLSEAQRQFDIGKAGRDAAAIKGGAFGGGRQAVQEGLAEQQLSRQKDQITGQGLYSAYGQGTQQFNADRQAAGQAVGLQQGLGAATQGLGINAMGVLGNVGAQQQAQQQQLLSQAYQDFINQRDWNKQQIGWQSDIVHGISSLPHDTTTTQTNAPPSTISQLAGLGVGAYGLSKLAKGGKVTKKFDDGGGVQGAGLNVATYNDKAASLLSQLNAGVQNSPPQGSSQQQGLPAPTNVIQDPMANAGGLEGLRAAIAAKYPGQTTPTSTSGLGQEQSFGQFNQKMPAITYTNTPENTSDQWIIKDGHVVSNPKYVAPSVDYGYYGSGWALAEGGPVTLKNYAEGGGVKKFAGEDGSLVDGPRFGSLKWFLKRNKKTADDAYEPTLADTLANPMGVSQVEYHNLTPQVGLDKTKQAINTAAAAAAGQKTEPVSLSDLNRWNSEEEAQRSLRNAQGNKNLPPKKTLSTPEPAKSPEEPPVDTSKNIFDLKDLAIKDTAKDISLPERPKDELSESAKGRIAVAAALGILSGTSPHALVNIGTGGQKGLEEYKEERKLQSEKYKQDLEAFRYLNEARTAARKGDVDTAKHNLELANAAVATPYAKLQAQKINAEIKDKLESAGYTGDLRKAGVPQATAYRLTALGDAAGLEKRGSISRELASLREDGKARGMTDEQADEYAMNALRNAKGLEHKKDALAQKRLHDYIQSEQNYMKTQGVFDPPEKQRQAKLELARKWKLTPQEQIEMGIAVGVNAGDPRYTRQ